MPRSATRRPSASCSAGAVVAQLGHRPEHREGAPVHRRDRRASAARIDSGFALYASLTTSNAVRALGDLHAPARRRAAPCRARLRPRASGQARVERDRRCRERVGDVVLADQAEPHRRRGAVRVQREGCASGAVEGDVGGAHVAVRAEGPNARNRARAHTEDERVVGVQDGETVGRQRLDELALRRGDRLARAELAEMRAADVEHRADLWRRDPGQVRDVPDAACAEFENEEPGVGVGLEHRVRQAEFVVGRAGRRDRRAEFTRAGGRAGPWWRSCPTSR